MDHSVVVVFFENHLMVGTATVAVPDLDLAATARNEVEALTGKPVEGQRAPCELNRIKSYPYNGWRSIEHC